MDVAARWVFVTSTGTFLGFAVDEICKEKDKDCFDKDPKISLQHSVCAREIVVNNKWLI